MNYRPTPPITDQWLLNGDCTKCRRNKYCKKPCKRCNMAKRRAFTELVLATAAQIIKEASLNATYVSVWNGDIEVKSRCFADPKTREITNMQPNNFHGDDGELEILEKEYIILDNNSTIYPACCIDDMNVTKEEYPNKDIYYYK